MKLELIIATTMLFAKLAFAADPILIADFEGENYGAWKTTGEAFGPGPAHGPLAGQMNVEGFQGKGLVNSFFNGDDTTGTLTSPEFKLERKFLSFLIGGGMEEKKLALNLLIDGKIVRHATGPNGAPGGSEALLPGSWDIGEFRGKSAVIQMVDEAKGSWGHLSVDQLVQTDQQPAGWLVDAKREFKVTGTYLHLPIKDGAPNRKVTLLMDGKVQVRNDIGLADGKPDWWAPMDVSAYKGQTVTLQVDRLLDDSTALSSIDQSDAIKDIQQLYHEPLRGQLHFSPQRGWNNDPNGMVFFHGEYHLFYQHNPYGWAWGNMHWGHTVSKDMFHWKELGDVLAPDELGPMFSGSAVVDWKNTSGFGTDGKPPLVLIYTAAGDPTVQCIAYSNDGRKFTKYPGNPVVKQFSPGNRDPKVMWYEPTKKWVMVFYVELPGKQHSIHFMTSPNLREWTLASITKGGIDGDKYLFECPDFFELPVDGDAAKKQWVLIAANSEYAIGTFDGTTFQPEHHKLLAMKGRGFYAAQTFSDVPANDGRRVQIGWLQTNTPGMAFNQSMSLPLELQLVTTPDGPRLKYQPVKEMKSLEGKPHTLVDPVTLDPTSANPFATFNLNAELLELSATVKPKDASELSFTVRGATLRYDFKKQELSVNDHTVAVPMQDGQLSLRLFCDRTCLEIFANGGLSYVPFPCNAKPDDFSLNVQVKGGSAELSKVQVTELQSAWK